LIALAPAGINWQPSADNRVDSSGASQRSQHAMKPDIGSESRFLPTPPAFDAPLGGFGRNIAMPFGMEKLELLGYRQLKFF